MSTILAVIAYAVALAVPVILIVDYAMRRSAVSFGRSGGTRAEGGRPDGEAAAGLCAPRRDESRRMRMVLELVAAEGCRFKTEGSPCRDLPDLNRDLGWCAPCLAADALDLLNSSTPVSRPGVEAASPAAQTTSRDAAGDASNFP